MYKYKKYKHAYICTHTQTFACTSAHSRSYIRTLYTLHSQTHTHARTHANTHTYTLAGIHIKWHARTCRFKHFYEQTHEHSHKLVSRQHKYMYKHSRVCRCTYTHACSQTYTHKCTHKHKHAHLHKNACKH